jgi:hypothetical protein
MPIDATAARPQQRTAKPQILTGAHAPIRAHEHTAGRGLGGWLAVFFVSFVVQAWAGIASTLWWSWPVPLPPVLCSQQRCPRQLTYQSVARWVGWLTLLPSLNNVAAVRAIRTLRAFKVRLAVPSRPRGVTASIAGLSALAVGRRRSAGGCRCEGAEPQVLIKIDATRTLVVTFIQARAVPLLGRCMASRCAVWPLTSRAELDRSGPVPFRSTAAVAAAAARRAAAVRVLLRHILRARLFASWRRPAPR